MATELSAWVLALALVRVLALVIVLVLVMFFDVGSLTLLLICKFVALNTVKM
jgi:hypothetical protein